MTYSGSPWNNRRQQPRTTIPSMLWRAVSTAAVFSVATTLSCAAPTDEQRAQHDPVAVFELALDVMVTPSSEADTGHFELRSVGTLDKRAEGQGLAPGLPSPGPYSETFAFDQQSGQIAWAYHEERFDGTFEVFREVYPDPHRRLYVVDDPPLVIPASAERFAADRLRLTRRLPHLLLAELLEQPDDLRIIDRSDGAIHAEGRLTDGTRLSVELDDSSGELRRFSYTASLAGRGETEVAWWFDDYRPVDGFGRFPLRYGSTVGGHPYTEMAVESLRPGGLELFEVPQGHRELPERELDHSDAIEPLELEPIGPGLFRAPEVRGGFAPLVAAFEEFAVVVDAPASFPLLGKIPAEETDPASSMSWHAERLVDAIAEQLDGLPVRYLVLTHGHHDHVGGVRAFVAAGATVLAAPALRPVVEHLVGLDGVADRLAEAEDAHLQFEAIESSRTIEAGALSLDLIPLGDNPHADGMLVVHIPSESLVYVSDLVTPEPLEVYPRQAHAALDRFFATWLEGSGLVVDRVAAMHGAPVATLEHLAKARAGGG